MPVFDKRKNPDFYKEVFGIKEETEKPTPAYQSHNPDMKRIFREYLEYDTDRELRRRIMCMTEAEHNKTLMNLTDKLYDQIVSKSNQIDYGEIPGTKGDITKMSNYQSMKDTIALLIQIINEYHQDTRPIQEVSLAIANIESRRDLFERAYRYSIDLGMMVYENAVLACVVGVSHMITTCIEYIKAPKGETFIMQLDKVAYNKSKDALIYRSLNKFNNMCKSGELDNAINDVIDRKVRKFTGAGVAAGIVIAVFLIANLIPMLREMVFLFYHMRVSISDYFDAQSYMLTMNAYNLRHNTIRDDIDVEEVATEQEKVASKFKDIANFFSIRQKKAEVEAERDIQGSVRKYKVDDAMNVVSTEPEGDSGSALF